MALRTIMLRREKALKEKRAEELRNQLKLHKQREDELAQAIEEASTEEEVAAVEAAVEELETTAKTTKEALAAILKEIQDIIDQIDEAEAAQDEAVEEVTGDEPADENTGDEEARSSRRRRENRTMNHRMSLREAQEFQRTGKHVYKDIRSFVRSITGVLTSTTGVVGPTGVGGINDAIGAPSSFLDLIKLTDCTGMASYKVSYQSADGEAGAGTEGTVPTESEPTFGSVTLTPALFNIIDYVSKEIRKQSPLNYEEKVTASARRALRRKLNKAAVDAVVASSINESYALVAAADASTGAVLFTPDLLSNLILSYGGDEGVEGAAYLTLNKADLKAFAAVRGTNEYLPVYSILPDASNPSTGIIKDNNGLSCRYCLSKDVAALSTTTLTTTAKKTMFYGNPQCCEMGLWGDVEVDVNDGYKFGEGLITVRGEASADADVTVYHGFVVVTAKKASA